MSMLSGLRAQVQTVLEKTPCARRPALRRASQPAWLLATDLPQLTGPETLRAAAEALEALGWRCGQENGWLLLDRCPERPESPTGGHYTGEAACVVRLLRLHRDTAPAPELLRGLLKAEEAGERTLARLCASLHQELAARLRLRQPMPDLLPWLLCALGACGAQPGDAGGAGADHSLQDRPRGRKHRAGRRLRGTVSGEENPHADYVPRTCQVSD